MSKLSRFIARKRRATRNLLWRIRNDYSPNARALYILGVQRSGTTMLIDCLERNPEIEVYGEDSAAMVDWRLRDNETIRRLIMSSPCKVVTFKPLTDSHRAAELLALSPGSAAIWAFRRFEDRANSAVAKFGTNNQELLAALSRGERLDAWQALGLSPGNFDLIRSFDYQAMSAQSAAAVFWYVRNSLFFDQGLDERDDVLPLAYEELVANPGPVLRSLCQFMGCTFRDSMISEVHEKSVGKKPSNIDARVAALCEPMYQRLRSAQERSWHALGSSI